MSKSLTIFLLLICMVLSGVANAQNTAALKKADDFMNSHDYYFALENYLKVYDKKPNDATVIEKILRCNQFLHNYTDVLTWSEQLVRLNGQNPDYNHEQANALYNLGKYKEAKAAYITYLKMAPTESKAILPLIQSCDSSMKWLKAPFFNVKVSNVSALNTGYSDCSLTRFGSGFMFSSDRRNTEAEMMLNQGKKSGEADMFGGTGRPYIKLYYVNQNGDSSWTQPAYFSKLVTEKYHTSTASFDEKGNILYFTRTRKIDIPKSFNKTTFRAELVYSEAFRDVKPFPYNSILNYSIGDPSVTPDGKKLYFASDMPGGLGGNDLYFCTLKPDGSWSTPTNLGKEVNSPGNERFPSIVGDSILYFSSDGHIGMGGLDIYVCYKTKKGGWSVPKNLGPPMNSPVDDFSVIVTKYNVAGNGATSIEGYFSSDRPGGKGSDDIYSFNTDQPQQVKDILYVKGKIINEETGDGIPDVKVAVKEVNSPEPTKNVKTDSSGTFKVEAKQHKKYAVTVKREKFFAKKDTISVDDQVAPKANTPPPPPMKLEPMVLNKAIRLDNIYYKFNDWAIGEQAAGVLDGLVKIMIENPEIDIELSSHTDTRGDAAINKYISQMRAQAAVNYLISKNVDGHRIYAKGYGKEMPLVKCGGNCTEDDHAKNRRTEFKIVKIQEQASK